MNDVLGTGLLSLGVAGVITFVALYSWRAPWWRTEVGWWLVTFPASLGLLMANGLVFRIAGDYPGRNLVSLVLFVVVVASVWWCVALLIKETKRIRRMSVTDMPRPMIGRIVHYTLTERDAEQINAARNAARSTYSIDHRGNDVTAGDVYPMVITRVWGDQPESAVNGQVLLDGNDTLWVSSVCLGEGERHFVWPPRA